ncbi:MAG: PIG-L family deacetylase, partial [Cytophagaceae bacterium]
MQKITVLFIACASFLLSANVSAQPDEKYNSAQILQDLKKLNVLGSVLYIAAHPDDENTRLITYFTREKLYNTAYISLTRGDGGQNLIGSELYEQLGLIRTQELMQARKVDGGKQFFSRAKDFGFSKNPDETFQIWDKEKVLADMVWAIRKFRPDVMITRFNTEPGKTHGHHTASAILAVEAFDAAADPTRFPEQLKYVEVWQAKRLLWNTNWWFYGSEKDFKTEGLMKIDVGTYNATLGESYTEIAARSRSMHKSQGFGSGGVRGTAPEYLEHTKGPKATNDIFEDVDASWSRIAGAEKVSVLLQKAAQNFDPRNPAASIDVLLEAREAMRTLPDSYWKKVKLDELEHVIKACLGLWTEAVASDYSAVPGQSLKVNIEVINRTSLPAELQKISYLPALKDTTLNLSLKENISNVHSTRISIPINTPYTQPYWLRDEGSKGMFTVNDQLLIGLPENPPAVEVEFTVSVKGKVIVYKTPVVYKKTDPVKGEQYRPFEITPALFISSNEKLLVFADNSSKELEVSVKSGISEISGTLTAELPAGWKCEPALYTFNLSSKGAEKNFTFRIIPSAASSEGKIKLSASTLRNAFLPENNFSQGLIS